jgi:hypothetical protein
MLEMVHADAVNSDKHIARVKADRSAIHPNPAWHPKPSGLWPPVHPTLHQTLSRDAPETPRSTSDRRSEVLRGVSGGATEV